jgi:hypothetical protein
MRRNHVALNDGLPHLSILVIRDANLKVAVVNQLGESQSLSALRKSEAEVHHARLAEVVTILVHPSQHVPVLIVWKLRFAHDGYRSKLSRFRSDKSSCCSVLRRTGGDDCNRDAPAGFVVREVNGS